MKINNFNRFPQPLTQYRLSKTRFCSNKSRFFQLQACCRHCKIAAAEKKRFSTALQNLSGSRSSICDPVDHDRHRSLAERAPNEI